MQTTESNAADSLEPSTSSQSVSEYDELVASLREDPYQPEKWTRRVALVQRETDVEKIKATFDELLQHYPNTPSAQIQYLNHFMTPERFSHAQSLFNKFLKPSPFIDLWKFYLDCVREKNPDRDDLKKSYEYALKHIGHDKDSGDVWNAYISFLQDEQTNSDWDKERKRDEIRKVYHRAVQVPTTIMDKLWADYEAFEMAINKTTATKFMSDLSPARTQARLVLRQLKSHVEPLGNFVNSLSSILNNPISLPSPSAVKQEARKILPVWKTYLRWEEGNPLELEANDSVLFTRIQSAYRKALVRMRFHPEIWFMASTWYSTVGKQDEAQKLLEEGIKVIPKSLLLTYSLAHLYEKKKQNAQADKIYENLLNNLRDELQTFEYQAIEDNTSLSQETQPAEPVEQAAAYELREMKENFGGIWINYIRFKRRSEGVDASRKAFGLARKSNLIPWQVYEAAALMEYKNPSGGKPAPQDIAVNIFKKGMERFNTDMEYVYTYLEFLLSINDEKNARALFNDTISSPTVTPEMAQPLWERWSQYEYAYGNIEDIESMETRIAEVYPKWPALKRFAQQYTYYVPNHTYFGRKKERDFAPEYLNIDGIASRDIGFKRWERIRRAEAGQTMTANHTINGSFSQPPVAPAASITIAPPKRRNSPDLPRKREGEENMPVPKRARPLSPPRAHSRDRDPKEKDREREGRWGRDRDSGPRRRSPPGRFEREEPPPVLSPVIKWFAGQLPAANTFDGPVFRTDDLMNLIRNAIIPSSNPASAPPSARPRSPPNYGRGGHSGGGGSNRPPPDYGPYRGPNSGPPRGGRY